MKMNTYYYSPSTRGFYHADDRELYEKGDGWPEDAVPVSDDDYLALFAGQQAGKLITPGDDGYPKLMDRPAPTPEQLQAAATAKKAALLAEATDFIAPLRDALDGGYIDDADKPKLVAWQKYRYDLTKVDPTKPVWPAKPE